MIIHYLHAEPADDLNDYTHQAARALFLERRYYESMTKIMGTAK